MRLALALLLCAACAPVQRAEPVPKAPSLAFTHVNVVDVESGRVLPEQTVLIAGNRIQSVGPSARVKVPSGAQVVDATGKYMIPGLWDMHLHLVDPDTPGSPDVVLPLLVANGVTGGRDLGAMSLDSILQLRSDVRTGRRIGPRLVVAGKLLDGAPVVFPPDAVLVRTAEEGPQIVDSLAAPGVDVIKPYEMLRRDVFLAVVDQAKRRGLLLAAHVPLSLDAAEVSDAGVHTLEHLRNLELACSSKADSLRAARTALLEEEGARVAPQGGLAFAWSAGYGGGAAFRAKIHRAQRPRARETYDPERCADLLRRFARNGTWQDPTLAIENWEVERPDTSQRVRATLRYVPPRFREAWGEAVDELDKLPPEETAELEMQARWLVRLVGAMREAGVGLLTGMDVSNPYMVPGFSIHEELRSLTRAGLTPAEALRAATLNPARSLEATDSLGTVERGKLADLVLLDANPLQDIGNARKISAVVLNGRFLDRSALDQLLAEAERAANTLQN